MIRNARIAPYLFLALLLTFLVSSAAAQTGLDRMIFMGGTTTLDAQGRDWAFLSWQATEPQELRSRMFAVYAKPGEPTSAASYERRAIVAIQTDPIVLQPLLQRSVHLGQNLLELEQTINNTFETLMPDMSLPLADKLSAVIRGSLDDPNHFKNLILMARLHPAVGMALGWAHAEMIAGPAGTPTTFELRAYDMTADRDIGVVGRVTVRTGQPLVLPAPGRPVEVPDISPKGDLNARMRWSTPDGLRRVSLMQHGYNVYRVPRALAEDNDYHVTPPATAELLALVASDPFVHRLNHVPILAGRSLSEAEALDLAADPETFFYSDWNDRFNPATALPQDDFVNGAQFYYFLTARDLLGRDGEVSPGTLMTICDRMPPPAPRRVRVVNHYDYDGTSADQRLQVVWRQNQNNELETTTAYFIYRWTSVTQFHAQAGDPAFNLIAGPIPHIPGSITNSFLDNGPGAPEVATDAGVTFWYTVVALDDGACAPEPNRGPHSAMAYGVLRDRVAPGGGGGRIEITCVRPVVVFGGPRPDVSVRDLDTNAFHYQLTTLRQDPRVDWAEYYYEIPGVTPQPVYAGRQFFAPGEEESVLPLVLPKAGLSPNASPMFRGRVGSNNGKVSEFAFTTFMGFAADGTARPIYFEADMDTQRTSPDAGCEVHDPHGGGDGTIDDICLTAFLAEGAKEVKFYRRLAGGPLTLVCQQEADFDEGETTALCCDGGMPAQPSDICYFVQFFDEHGNSGPMIRIGCVETGPNAPLPIPVLSTITSLGTSTNARMKIEWACAPYGVERFEVWMTGNPLAPGKGISPDLTLTNEIQIGVPLPPGALPQNKMLQYLTRRIGPSFGEGSLFSVEADVVPGNRYSVFVKAVGEDGTSGPRSNVESFAWNTTNAPTTDVPWPDRPLPAVTLTNFPGVVARVFHTNEMIFNPIAFPQQAFEGVGIRVGEVFMPEYPFGMTNAIAGSGDPMEHVYRSARDSRSLFPLVVYRVQETNEFYPEVSGDVVQVTPLMEQIAYDQATIQGGAQAVFVHDPFIRLIPEAPTQGSQDWELYLLDTQPVLIDATYRYVLVRLHEETREIAEVIPTNPVTITPGL